MFNNFEIFSLPLIFFKGFPFSSLISSGDLRLPICVAVNICFKHPVSFPPRPNNLIFDKFWSNVVHFRAFFIPPNKHLVSIRLDFALAGNEKWRKGWLQLTFPICSLYPLRPLQWILLHKIYFQSDLAGFRILDGWTWKQEFIPFEIPAQRLYFELSKNIYARLPIPVNNMVWN